MLELYRIEHPDGQNLYVKNDLKFLRDSGLVDHEECPKHKGIFDVVEKMYYKDINDLSIELRSENGSLYAIDYFFNIITPYFYEKTFRCFFNNKKCIDDWFTQEQLKKIIDAGYKLYIYSFVVDFDPMKIYICDVQSAIDIEYMEKESTVKTLVDWSEVYTLHKHFMEHINSMTDDELFERTQNAPDYVMGAIAVEYVGIYHD